MDDQHRGIYWIDGFFQPGDVPTATMDAGELPSQQHEPLPDAILDPVSVDGGREKPPAWFIQCSAEVQANVPRFVKSIEEDTDGWSKATREDMEYEFSITTAQANEAFKMFCSQRARLAIEAEEAAEAARARAAADAARAEFAGYEPMQRYSEMDWRPAAPAKSEVAEEVGQSVIEQLDIRACPSCHVLIEKRGGCPHMKCTSCRTSFWWERARPARV